jgi:hypothetical protein
LRKVFPRPRALHQNQQLTRSFHLLLASDLLTRVRMRTMRSEEATLAETTGHKLVLRRADPWSSSLQLKPILFLLHVASELLRSMGWRLLVPTRGLRKTAVTRGAEKDVEERQPLFPLLQNPTLTTEHLKRKSFQRSQGVWNLNGGLLLRRLLYSDRSLGLQLMLLHSLSLHRSRNSSQKTRHSSPLRPQSPRA